MNRENHKDIQIGTMCQMNGAAGYIKQILEHGFESFEPNCGKVEGINLAETAKQVLDVIGDEAVINAIGLYANPLQDPQAAKDWETMIRGAKYFKASVVSGFAGALEDRSVDQNIAKFKEVFTPLAKLAEDEGVKIAFENCDMGGTWNAPKWNIAHAPRAWEMMFNEVPSKALGLEWEPCHQMYSLIDPIAQLRQWAPKVFHVHGKDATVAWDVIEREGIRSGAQYVWHRTPGFGDTNWTDVITILRQNGFVGSIDVEGWHDPVYREELEMTGQVYALDYLKACRGGDFVKNPK